MNEPQRLNQPIQFDAFLPPEMARRAEQVGIKKATMPWGTTFVLAVLAGAFIALGAVFATIVTSGAAELPFGVTRLLAGFVFSLGLILVVVAGAELFTGNNLIVMAVASGEVSISQLLHNWTIVYAGNFVGSVATALIVVLSKQYTFGNGVVGLTALETATAKCQLDFVQAIVLGILCNALVCLAVWLCFSARSTTDKILAIVFPITAFVAGGFEHSIANMYFVPIGLLIKAQAADGFWLQIGNVAADFEALTLPNFLLSNLLPVTLGNILGGTVLVSAVYWFVYLKNRSGEFADGSTE